MGILPESMLKTIRGFNDFAVEVYGVSCTLYIPSNLTAIEGEDLYSTPADVTYTEYTGQKVWVDWAVKDIERLRKLGFFTEKELPITAYFRNVPEVTIGSYIKIPIKYIPETYNTDEFEIVNTIISNTYNLEMFRRFKLAPRRVD